MSFNSKIATTDENGSNNPAADLIRQKIQSIYQKEPDALEELVDLAGKPKSNISSHQQYILELTNSGKDYRQIQNEWHEYYAGLSDEQKHQVWHEFYSLHASSSKAMHTSPIVLPNSAKNQLVKTSSTHHNESKNITSKAKLSVLEAKKQIQDRLGVQKKLSKKQHFKSLLFGLGIGSLTLFIMLFGLFNERIIAPFISPSKSLTNTPIITDSTTPISSDPKIIIPKINVEIPVIYDQTSVNEKDVQKSLEKGVVHYADTANPGENGNSVIVGHSSNNIFNRGSYKFAFALLNRLEKEDTFILQKNSKRYVYKVYETKIVSPKQLDVLLPQSKAATVTLITCDPPGTSLNRLVVVGEQISPDPTENIALKTQNKIASTQPTIIPGNAPSLWSRIWNWNL